MPREKKTMRQSIGTIPIGITIARGTSELNPFGPLDPSSLSPVTLSLSLLLWIGHRQEPELPSPIPPPSHSDKNRSFSLRRRPALAVGSSPLARSISLKRIEIFHGLYAHPYISLFVLSCEVHFVLHIRWSVESFAWELLSGHTRIRFSKKLSPDDHTSHEEHSS
ncbi:hypothetical protein IEQ34_003003 [Dendrobium chrysotoxum]|uniref:Uncharacterized protein n=1 Tax=Dendrobium chrysotoxum TaxID=161865 RepID=A0AAV7H1K1_DENCH|nr:hypothetical protein IEQ34_003003 [Dendrobium chrysotoxum]